MLNSVDPAMPNNMWMRYLETLLLTGIVLALTFYFKPGDPLLLSSSFPWIWFLPVLFGLRHGRVCALLSSAMIVLVMLYTMSRGYFYWDDYRIWALGGITLAIICGEYQAFWLRRLIKLLRKENYLAKRYEAISIAYGVVRLSHDRLEEALIVKPTTLREAFIELQALLRNVKGDLDHDTLKKFLEILAFYTGIDKIGLFILGKQKTVTIAEYLRDRGDLNFDDPLVKHCLKNQIASYYAVNILDEKESSDYIAVLPIKTIQGTLLGLLTIKEMSFLALNEETLKTLTLLLSYFADQEWAAKEAKALLQVYPDCPIDFAYEALKLENVYKTAQIDTSVAAFYFEPHPKRDDLYYLIKQQKRALDVVWETERNDTKILLFLMPLTERSMFMGYLNRIEMLVKQDSQLKLGESPILLRHYQLSAYKNIVPLLKDALK